MTRTLFQCGELEGGIGRANRPTTAPQFPLRPILKKIFQLMDANDDGSIDEEEGVAVFRAMGAGDKATMAWKDMLAGTISLKLPSHIQDHTLFNHHTLSLDRSSTLIKKHQSPPHHLCRHHSCTCGSRRNDACERTLTHAHAHTQCTSMSTCACVQIGTCIQMGHPHSRKQQSSLSPHATPRHYAHKHTVVVVVAAAAAAAAAITGPLPLPPP